MQLIRKTLLALIAFCPYLPAIQGESLSIGHNTQIHIDQKNNTWTINNLRGGLHVQNGRTDSELSLQAKETYFETLALPGVRFQVQYLPKPDHVEVEITVVNNGSEQLWLEPQLEVAMKAEQFEWFDGFRTHSKPNRRDEIVGTLPFAAIYHDGNGLAIGLDPTQLVSHFASSVSEQDSVGQLTFSSKMVVDPGTSETRRFVLFAVSSEFQYLNAVAAYQNWFPQTFKVTTGVHPNLSGPSKGTFFWRSQNEIYPAAKQTDYFPQIVETLRWAGPGWDWCYSGFGYRPGDWLCTEELTGDWLVNDKVKGKISFREYFKMNATEYLQQHQNAYKRMVALKSAPMMYIIPSYCEQELAETKFPDSIYYNAQGQTSATGPPWVNRFDRSLVMYSHGNSYGDYTQKAIKEIVRRSEIYGFAFDCIDRARLHYTGPGVERSPGRAYDKDLGVYVNMEIAHAIFGQKVHELSRNGYTMALTGNSRGSSTSYLSASAMDATVIEHSPWDKRPQPFTLRLLMGQKPITFWHAYQSIPDLDKLDKEQLLKTISTLADFTVLQALYLGIYPSIGAVIGSPKLLHYSTIFNDLFRNYGWDPVPAAHGPEELWLSRYGSGAGGILAVGNATPKESNSKLDVVASYFDAASVAFVDYEGQIPILNEIKLGNTDIPVRLQQGEALILAAGLHWNHSFTGSVEGKRETSRGEFVRDTWTIQIPEASEGTLFIAEIPGHTVNNIFVAGKSLEFEKENGRIKFQPSLAKGKTVVQIDYIPDVVISEKNVLAKVNLLNDDESPNFTIVLAEDDPELHYQALRIQSLFSEMDVDQPLASIPIVKKSEGMPDGVAVVLEINQATDVEGKVSGNERTISITGRNAGALEKAVSLLLEEWHPIYGSYGYLMASNTRLANYLTSLRPGVFQKTTDKKFLPWNSKDD